MTTEYLKGECKKIRFNDAQLKTLEVNQVKCVIFVGHGVKLNSRE